MQKKVSHTGVTSSKDELRLIAFRMVTDRILLGLKGLLLRVARKVSKTTGWLLRGTSPASWGTQGGFV